MSVFKEVERYVLQYPSVKDCLKEGLVNYSALSRMIISDLKLSRKDFDAVLVSCRRLQRRLRGEPSSEKKVRDILSAAKIDIKTGISVFILERDVYIDDLTELEKRIRKKSEVFHLLEGVNTLTLITRQEFAEEIKELFKNKIIRKNEGLVELMIRTSKEIEKTYGVLSYLYSLLAENKINVFETFSTWTDTVILIDEANLENAVKLFKF
ncbi:MAG TPA: ACT domain-containing protein [Candidatus Nanoarchaeia archaeon]|nr:ACT domain-containing protein [Candidatus Nanoarchaeia archaeon]